MTEIKWSISQLDCYPEVVAAFQMSQQPIEEAVVE